MTRPIPRGGHFPGHVRDAFLEAVEAFTEWKPNTPEPTVTAEVAHEPRPITISAACRLLWNCSDVLPGDAYRSLEGSGLPLGRQTYASAARAMLQSIGH
jgi:hypothetical protein